MVDSEVTSARYYQYGAEGRRTGPGHGRPGPSPWSAADEQDDVLRLRAVRPVVASGAERDGEAEHRDRPEARGEFLGVRHAALAMRAPSL